MTKGSTTTHKSCRRIFFKNILSSKDNQKGRNKPGNQEKDTLGEEWTSACQEFLLTDRRMNMTRMIVTIRMIITTTIFNLISMFSVISTISAR